ncbi:hypothetical protein EJ03DRAFT_4033 [Teratosphaeria nubilosa]|uniref:Uncharacterized protein n=1 Tax=Teratosphaeria nubilosa TaxID=161662 RepID=A0A6G1LMW9_9PEZI|nr:hypothetical protein EJ03DRAFT_4033 [Teratosphaeria nubilosa]
MQVVREDNLPATRASMMTAAIADTDRDQPPFAWNTPSTCRLPRGYALTRDSNNPNSSRSASRFGRLRVNPCHELSRGSFSLVCCCKVVHAQGTEPLMRSTNSSLLQRLLFLLHACTSAPLWLNCGAARRPRLCCSWQLLLSVPLVIACHYLFAAGSGRAEIAVLQGAGLFGRHYLRVYNTTREIHDSFIRSGLQILDVPVTSSSHTYQAFGRYFHTRRRRSASQTRSSRAGSSAEYRIHHASQGGLQERRAGFSLFAYFTVRGKKRIQSMAEVALAGHARHGSIIGTGPLGRGVPKVEMIANPDFSFPIQPLPAQPLSDTNRRPVSMQSSTAPHLRAGLAHRRAVSNLPSFSFNAADASGRQDSSSSPHTPEELTSTPPSRATRKHTRRGSEFVGGDSRLGVAEAISSSPTKSNVLDLPHPSGTPRTRRGHAHRRSTAMSSHDVSEIMKPAEAQPRLSTSLPTTPLEHPGHSRSPSPMVEWTSTLPELRPKPGDLVGSSLVDDADVKPTSRRVGFSDNVEFIPRPLSTISSETESSMSTARGHSVNNSITSVLSMTSPGPPSARQRQTSLSTTYEDDARPRVRNSVEVSKRVEKEGEWLRSSVSSSSSKRPLTEPTTQSPSSAVSSSVLRGRMPHGKKHSISHALGLDRRRSEPSLSIQAEHLARLSAISLQEQAGQGSVLNARTLDRKSSSRKIKDWAMSRLSRRSRESKRESVVDREGAAVRPQSAASTLTPGKIMRSEEPVAETDLDAVLGQADAVEQMHLTAPTRPRFEVSTPTPSWTSSTFGSQGPDDDGSILDLDAALGSSIATGSNLHKPRRELHSSRLKNDFVGPGLHYHRRAESAPELVPFAHQRGSTISQASLPDVFEGEGEEEAEAQHEGGVGIQVVDSDSGASDTLLNFDDRLRIQQSERLLERPWTANDSGSSRLSTPTLEHRPSFIMEEAIPEELSPVEIIRHDEEPRASSLTKSSDSSETPTLMAPRSDTLLQRPAQAFMTTDTYRTSAFSSPDLARRQGSFDTSRVGTSASSVTDNRTISSCAEPPRTSTDDVPSLTSSLSTRMSMMPANTSRRDFSSSNQSQCDISDSAFATDRRKKRASIASFSQLVGGSFSGRSKVDDQLMRPQTAVDTIMHAPKKEHRLKKLMFWRSKSKQSLRIAS